MSPRASGCRGLSGGTGGAAGMWSLSSIVVAFLLVSAAVIALARSSTARWERERAAARGRGREAVAPPAPHTGAAARLHRALGGAAPTARRPAAGPIRVLLRALSPALAASRHVARGVRTVPQRWDAVWHAGGSHRHPTEGEVVPRPMRAEDPSADHGEMSGAVAHAPEPPRTARLTRRRLRAGIAHHDPSSATLRLTHQLAAWVVHRRDKRRPPPLSDEHSGPAS